MVKKTVMEERQERLEQEFEGLALEVRTQGEALREWMEKFELRFQKKPRRRRSGSGLVTPGAVEDDGDDSSTETEKSGGNSPRFHHRYRGRKLEIPVFEGGEAYGWLVKVERYFKINGVEEDEMLEAVMIALDGRALNWFQWWEEQHPEPTWDEFKQAVIRRFQPGLVRNPLGPILSVKQTGTVMEYREQFEMLMAPLKRGERGMLESIFLNGLSEEIQTELKLHNTRGLSSMMDRALLIEERNKALKDDGEKKSGGNRWRSSGFSSGSDPGKHRTVVAKSKFEFGGGSGSNSQEPKNQGGGGEKKQGMGKKLTQEELRDLSRKGLCFKCGERWGRDHICKMKHFRVELIEEEESEEEEEKEETEEEEEVVVELKTLMLSLKSKEGLTSNRSFKVWGIINGRKVLILIDCGASSNFISYKLVDELKLALEDTPEYTIEVGNGEKITHKGVCMGLKVQVQGINFTQNFYLMTLAGTELVLGMDWLASLGDIKANFQNMIIKWKGGGQKFKIRGERSLSKQQASLKSMRKALREEEGVSTPIL